MILKSQEKPLSSNVTALLSGLSFLAILTVSCTPVPMRVSIKKTPTIVGTVNPGSTGSTSGDNEQGIPNNTSGRPSDRDGSTTQQPSPSPSIPSQVKLGLDWPESKIFPTFQAVATLDVIERKAISEDEISAVVSLQGLINRMEPRIFILSDTAPSRLWLGEIGGKQTKASKALDLIEAYKSEVKGLVIYDDRLVDTINLATTISGIEDLIVVSPKLAETLKAMPYSMPVVKDLRELNFKTALEVYQYQFDNYAAKASHRIIFGLDPKMKGYLRDYAVATKGLMIWLNPEGEEKPLLKRYLSLLSHNSPYFGWWKDEPKGVHEAALHGVPVYAADWSSNLTAMGGKREIQIKKPAPPAPTLENKLYVSVFVSDGDNIQEDETLIPLKWNDSNRGKVPTAWTINPALVDVAPVILNYLHRTATVNDVLVSGPSGLGYTYPNAWPAGSFESYAKVSGEYMDRSGLNIATLWNNRVDLSPDILQAYLKHIPDLVGLTIQDESREVQIISNKVPVHRLTISYGDTEEILSHGVEAQLKNFKGDRPLFASVQANMNMGTIHPTAITALQKRYANNPKVVFVRPDHFFKLLAQAQKK